MLEDMGYFCVDNLPIALVDEIWRNADNAGFGTEQSGARIDVRSGEALDGLEQHLKELDEKGISYEILFWMRNRSAFRQTI